MKYCKDEIISWLRDRYWGRLPEAYLGQILKLLQNSAFVFIGIRQCLLVPVLEVLPVEWGKQAGRARRGLGDVVVHRQLLGSRLGCDCGLALSALGDECIAGAVGSIAGAVESIARAVGSIAGAVVSGLSGDISDNLANFLRSIAVARVGKRRGDWGRRHCCSVCSVRLVSMKVPSQSGEGNWKLGLVESPNSWSLKLGSETPASRRKFAVAGFAWVLKRIEKKRCRRNFEANGEGGGEKKESGG